MFWADRIAAEIKDKVIPRAGAGKPLLIRDEKTVSGKVHVGSMRGVAIHGALWLHLLTLAFQMNLNTN